MNLLDLTAYACPIPLVKIKLALKADQSLPMTVLLSDSGSKRDVPKFLKNKGYQLRCSSTDTQVLQLVIEQKI